jgi:hypothetical protein
MDTKIRIPKMTLQRETIRVLNDTEQERVGAGRPPTIHIPFSAEARCTRDWQDGDQGTTCNAACTSSC